MDLLEYQGKQLFAKHGVPVPEGRPARAVDEAVEAAEELGYPVVIKTQVQIGGRGKAGGVKWRLAEPRRQDDGARGCDRVRLEAHGGDAEGLEAKGVRVGRNPTQVSEIAVEILGTRV